MASKSDPPNPEEAESDGGADQPEPSSRRFVVGIGASAGGLEALHSLLGRVPADRTAFVVVQHLAPNQKSLLAELLGRASRLQVLTAQEGMPVDASCVYVSPPNAELAILKGVFHLLTPTAGGRPQLPIDALFRSLAEDQGSKAIGVVLSGTGTDGTFGLAAIKAAGGITFVQEPSTAKFNGMPRSALESGHADFCLSPEAIADEIARIGSHPYMRPAPSAAPQLEEHLGTLALLMRNAFGIDLTHYKPSMIERRIQRRMAVHRVERISDYVRFCQVDAKELATMYKDLLISVTSFFRDHEPFDALKTEILPLILEGKMDTEAVRVWVPGCSTGEEAYSIAICLLEALEEKQRNPKIQIFGSDIDQDAIAQARRGLYPPNIEADVSPERLRKFFVKTDDNRYQISRRIRDLAVFSIQNVSKDAPFCKLDLVSCRNLLIYLQPGIQKKVLRILHYSLNPNGFLLLGASSTVGDSPDLFTLVDRKNKIYKVKHVALPDPHGLGVGVLPSTRVPQVAQLGSVRPMATIAQLVDRRVLEQYGPPGVVINENLDIVYFRGGTGNYLEQPSGAATHNILRLIRPELRPSLKHAIEATLSTNEPVTVQSHIRNNGSGFRPLTLVLQPLQEPQTKARCLLVLFRDDQQLAEKPARILEVPPEPGATMDQQILDLSQELALTKEYLQSTIEELEGINEDLKSTNEELQSSNEELQSTNEELETSKEELQSTNEELITLNDELQNRMRDLSQANDDLHNILLGVDRPVVIVGLDLRIRRFTQSAERILNLVPADIGRSVSQLNSFVGGFGIEKSVLEAIQGESIVEREMQATDRRWYRLRIVPYKTLDLAIRGAVLTFIDIEVPKRRSELTRAVDEYATEFLSAIQHPLLIVNRELAVIWANDAYYQAFQVLPEETVGVRVASLGTGQWSGSRFQKLLQETLTSGAPFRNCEVDNDLPDGGKWQLRASGSLIRGVGGEKALVLVSIEGYDDKRTRAG